MIVVEAFSAASDVGFAFSADAFARFRDALVPRLSKLCDELGVEHSFPLWNRPSFNGSRFVGRGASAIAHLYSLVLPDSRRDAKGRVDLLPQVLLTMDASTCRSVSADGELRYSLLRVHTRVAALVVLITPEQVVRWTESEG